MAEKAESKKAEAKREEPRKEAKGATDERLAFPEACIVRIMKRHMDKEKMIKKEVKTAMNKWLEKLCANVAKNMNKFPYVMMTKSEFSRGIKVYDTLEEFEKEKQRILAHMDAMKKDIERLERDLGKTEQEVMEMS
jgi:histone H3/H4